MPAALAFVGGMFSFGAGTAFAAGGAAFAGWTAGAAFAGTIVGGLTVKLLTTVALGALSSAMAPDTPQGGGLTISSTVTGEQQPETITLGKYATGGQAICAPYSHGKSHKYLTHVIELCSAPGAQLSRLMLAGEWVTLGPPSSDDVALDRVRYGQRVATGKYAGRVWVKFYDGSQTAADPYLVGAYGTHADRPWTPDMVGKGICYAILTFAFHEEKMTQVPQYRFELTGIPLYDLRKDSSTGGNGTQRLADPSTWAVSHNPIVMTWNIVRGIPLPGGDVYGGNITDLRRLPRDVWIAAMNRCDAAVTLSGGGTEPAYRAGLEIALDQPPAAAIEELLKAASATIADLGYGWGIVAGAPALPVYSFTDDDVIVSRSQELEPFPGLQETYNAVGARFPDPKHFWETKEAPQRTNAAWEAADAFGRRMADLSLPAVPYGDQVQRLMRAWIEDERRFRRHVITLPPDAAHVELIDTIDWASARNGYDGKDFSVHEILEDARVGTRQMSIRERDPLDYSWRPDFELPSAPAPGTPTPVAPEPVSGYAATAVTLKDATGTARRAGIRQVWDPEIVAQGIRWEIRLAGTTAVILEGSTQDVERGTRTVAEGILPAEHYDIRARLILSRDTEWTSWRTVITEAVAGEAVDIPAELIDRVNDLEDWATGTDDHLDDIRDEMAADVGRIEERMDGVQDDLTAEAAALRAEASAHLNTAKSYTDTEIVKEAFTRKSATDSLAAQIQTLTAALVSDNLIAGGQFLDGLAGWTAAGTVAVAARDEASTSTILRTMPAPFAASLSPGGSIARRSDMFSASADDAFQIRFAAGGDGGARSIRIDVKWLSAALAEITPAATQTVIAEAGGLWDRLAARFAPPAGARRADVTVTHITASGSVIRLTNIEGTLVNTAIEARVAELEAAQVTTAGALVTHKSETAARFGTNETRIANETTARAAADAAAGLKIAALESATGTAAGKIETIETTIADLNEAAATLEQTVSARFGAAEKVRDGIFADGLAWWPSGTLGTESDIQPKNKAGAWQYATMPAAQALIVRSGTAAGEVRRSIRMDVAPGDILDMSMAYARASSGVQPRLRALFRTAAGALIPPYPAVTGTGSGAWLSAFLAGIVAPALASTVEFDVMSAVDGVNHAWVTELSARKRQAFEHQAAADVAELKYAMTDPGGAIAGIRQTIEANFANLDGRATANAQAIANRYTKTQTDSAISTGIEEFNATLTSRFGAKANSSTVTALTSRVKDTEEGLAAQADAITKTQAQADRASAGGLLRITSEATPTGARSRIGLRVEASAGSVSQSAAAYLVAQTDGTSEFLVRAERFAVVTGTAADGDQTVPFIVRGGTVRMQDAIVDTLAIKDGSVSTFWGADAYSLTIALSYAADLAIFTGVSIRGTSSGWASTYTLTRSGTEIDRTTFSVSPYTWTFTNAKSLAVAAGTHTIRHQYTGNQDVYSRPRIDIMGRYR